MHDDKGPGGQLEGQQEGESMRILLDPPVSGLNHASLCLLYPSLQRRPRISGHPAINAIESDSHSFGFHWRSLATVLIALMGTGICRVAAS